MFPTQHHRSASSIFIIVNINFCRCLFVQPNMVWEPVSGASLDKDDLAAIDETLALLKEKYL